MNDPPVQVISAYRGMPAYIEQARARPAADLEQLWWDAAVAPYWAEWAAGQWNEERLRELLRRPVLDLKALAVEVEILGRSGVEQLVWQAVERIFALLPPCVPNPAICLYTLDPRNTTVQEKQNGVLGTGVGDNILLQIDPRVAGWQEYIPYVLAHEHHHAVWGYHYFYRQGHSIRV